MSRKQLMLNTNKQIIKNRIFLLLKNTNIVKSFSFSIPYGVCLSIHSRLKSKYEQSMSQKSHSKFKKN